jgi:hypothetical protein
MGCGKTEQSHVGEESIGPEAVALSANAETSAAAAFEQDAA